MTKLSTFKNIFLAVLAYLSTLAFGHIVALKEDPTSIYGGNYYGYNISSIVVFAFTLYLLISFVKKAPKRLKVLSSIAGFPFSLLLVYGIYAHLKNDIFIDLQTSLLQLAVACGISFFITPLLAQFFLLLEKGSIWFESKSSKKFQKLPDWGFFLICWIVIFACYIPIFLAHWPGNFIFDAKYQLWDVIRDTHSTHHPLAHTLLMGWAYNLGINMGNPSSGFQFYTLIQMAILSGSYALCSLYLYQKRAPLWVQIGAFLWASLFPINALFSITTTKDVIFAAFFLCFFVFTLKFYLDHKSNWQTLLGLVLFGTLSAIYRNNALYAIIVAFLVSIALIKTWKAKLLILSVMVGIYLCSSLTNQILINSTHARQPDTYRESLSLPLQSLARVASYKGDELDPNLLEEILLYIPKYRISQYNPYGSDPIKEFANEQLLKTNTFNFFKLWAKVGLLFPDEYIENLITNYFGFWYPLNQYVYVSSDIAIYHTLIDIGPEIVKETYCDWAYDLYYPFWSTEYRNIPIIGFLFRNAPYFWMVILSCLWAIYKKQYNKLTVLLLPFFYIATCFLGPMATLRYIYCIVVLTPVLIYLALRNTDSKIPQDKSSDEISQNTTNDL